MDLSFFIIMSSPGRLYYVMAPGVGYASRYDAKTGAFEIVEGKRAMYTQENAWKMIKKRPGYMAIDVATKEQKTHFSLTSVERAIRVQNERLKNAMKRTEQNVEEVREEESEGIKQWRELMKKEPDYTKAFLWEL